MMSMMGGGPPPFAEDMMGTMPMMPPVTQGPPTIVERNFVRPMPVPMAPPGPLFEMEPEYLEQVVEIPRVNIEHRERLVEIPQPQVVDRIVEVPMVQEIIKEEPGDVHELPITREAPVIEFA